MLEEAPQGGRVPVEDAHGDGALVGEAEGNGAIALVHQLDRGARGQALRHPVGVDPWVSSRHRTEHILGDSQALEGGHGLVRGSQEGAARASP